MPTPRKGEEKDHYLERCMSYGDMQKYPNKQRYAVCNSMWDEHHQTNKQLRNHIAYELKGIGEALDGPAKDVEFDKSKMTATGILATTDVDMVGDVIEVEGIVVDNHKINPVVLLDHGKQYGMPIGRTEDPDRNYTVRVVGKDCLQTTWFSQHDPVAEQIYHLYAERIMRGNSIGFKPLEVKPFPKGGRHIKKCILIEATWCALPCNPEAVTSFIQKNSYMGKSLVQPVRDLLLPFCLPKKTWANGVNLLGDHLMADKVETPNKGNKDMSAIDETSGGATVADEHKDEPLGATVLRSFHADLKDIHEQYADVLPKLEHEKVNKGMTKTLEGIKKTLSSISECHKDAYPDLDRLEPEVKDEDEGGDEGDDEKSLSKLLKNIQVQLGKLVETKSVSPAIQADEESLSKDEEVLLELEIARQEREIARQERLQSKRA